MEEKGKSSKRKRDCRLSKIIAVTAIFLVSIAIAFASLAVTVAPVIAQEEKVTVTINAPEYVEEKETFDVTIDVDDIEDFNTGLFDLSFDRDVVKVTGVEDGSIDGETIPVGMWRFTERDTIRVFLEVPGVTGVSGSGYLAKISFKVKGDEGDECILDLENSLLGNSTAEEIPAEWIDARIRVGVEEEEEEEPTVRVEVNTPECVEEGETFVITIDVDNMMDFNMGIFDLAFDSKVVKVSKVKGGQIDETPIPISRWKFMDSDTIKVMSELSGLTTASGTGYLAKISFEVVGKEGDESILHLSNGSLGNVFAEEIPAEWIDTKIKVVTPSPIPTPAPSPTPSPTPTPVTIYVPDDYPEIQSAVDNSEAGDTIIVRSGNYTENVKVNKRLTIQSENGSDLTIVRAVNPHEHVFEVTANHCKIIGFTVKGEEGDGIHLHGANYCYIADNNISNNWNGIYLYDSSNNIIAKNNVLNNKEGIYSLSSSNNTIKNNIALNNSVGIFFDFASRNNMLVNNDVNLNGWGISLTFFARNNTISNNNLSNNGVGIDLWDSNNNIIKSNNVSNNSCGIELLKSRYNEIENNNISNSHKGIELLNSSYNKVEKNKVSKNEVGIEVHYSSNNTINSNNASNNVDGIYLDKSTRNVIDNNIFANDGLFVWESYDNKIENNVVNGKPLVFLEEVSDYRIEDAGQVILVKCANITAENLDLSSTNVGIEVLETCNSKVINNNASSNNRYGIYLYLSNDNQIKNNKASNNDKGIYMEISSNNTVTKNTANANKIEGIYLFNSSNNCISNNNCSSNYHKITNTIVSRNEGKGIYLYSSSNNRLINNIAPNNDFGIFLRYSNNNTLTDNNANSNNGNGIHLRDSTNNSILHNNCSNNSDGIYLGYSNNNSILHNNCSNNSDGIYLGYSNNNKLTDNVMFENGIVIVGDSLSDYTHEIDESNTVNGKPVYYWKNREGGRIPDGAGQVILVNCSNTSVENQNLNNASVGIQIAFSSYIAIKNNHCSSNNDDGIRFYNSTNCNILNNYCSNNWNSIFMWHSTNNSISSNICSNNWDGISLRDSTNNSISNNICSSNINGISLGYSNNNKLRGNIMLRNGIVIVGDSLTDYKHEIDESNTVNGKPVYYWKNREGGRIPDDAGQVILVNCTNVLVEKQNLNNASVGIDIPFSSYITIRNNHCSNNVGGISLDGSNSNSISSNNCSDNVFGIVLGISNNNDISRNNCSNNVVGVFLWISNNNHIYLSNFINNAMNVYSLRSTNIWNSTEKLSYVYNGSTYKNYLGNYWSDYRGSDSNGDGIGDTLYGIDFDEDCYPLMNGFEKYVASNRK